MTFRLPCFSGLVSILALIVSPIAHAALVDRVSALEPGTPYRVLFTTSTSTTATSPTMELYDDFVQAAADAGSLTAPLGASWQAMISVPSASAMAHLDAPSTSSDPILIYRIDGRIIAESYRDLWDGSAGATYSVTENGTDVIGTRAWTGTLATGAASAFPAGHTGATTYGSLQDRGAIFDAGINPSTAALPIYGLSEVLVTPAVVPLPPAAWLLGTACIGLLGIARRRARGHARGLGPGVGTA